MSPRTSPPLPEPRSTAATATMASHCLGPFLREVHKLGPEVEEQARAEAAEVFSRLRLSLADVEAMDLRLPHHVAMALLAMLMKLTDDPSFGLRAAAGYQLGDFEPYDYVCRHSATLGDSIRAARDYMPLMHDGIDTELLVAGDLTYWRNRLQPGLLPSPEIHEFTTASLMAAARSHTGAPLTPLQVSFVHDRPAHATQLQEFFGCPVHFNAEYNGFVMPTIAMTVPMPHADLVLGRTLRRHADDLMRTLATRKPFTHAVTELVTVALEQGDVGLKNVAHKLGMSESTLRRRLTEEGRTHTDIVEHARQHLARRYLHDSQLSVNEIATRLGFAHAPAFHRAFKRWTGQTPAQFRATSAGPLVTRLLNPRPSAT